MFVFARQFWKMKVRSKRHQAIKKAAAKNSTPEKFGPFTIIYADPPTHFETFTASGGGRSPEQQYPTLSWEEIEKFKIFGKRIEEIAHDDAALFLWCTSSNLPYGLEIMTAWGFEFKASAVWDKAKQGTGFIFRNMHEVLLYGSRARCPVQSMCRPPSFAIRAERTAQAARDSHRDRADVPRL